MEEGFTPISDPDRGASTTVREHDSGIVECQALFGVSLLAPSLSG